MGEGYERWQKNRGKKSENLSGPNGPLCRAHRARYDPRLRRRYDSQRGKGKKRERRGGKRESKSELQVFGQTASKS